MALQSHFHSLHGRVRMKLGVGVLDVSSNEICPSFLAAAHFHILGGADITNLINVGNIFNAREIQLRHILATPKDEGGRMVENNFFLCAASTKEGNTQKRSPGCMRFYASALCVTEGSVVLLSFAPELHGDEFE